MDNMMQYPFASALPPLLPPSEPQVTLEQHKTVEFLLSNKQIPSEARKQFWAFTSKELAVTKFEEIDIKRVLRHLRIAWYDYIMNKPDVEYSFKDELLLSQLTSFVLQRAKRSLGGFEREMITKQIREVRTTYEEEIRGGGGGLLGKIKGFLFGRR